MLVMRERSARVSSRHVPCEPPHSTSSLFMTSHHNGETTASRQEPTGRRMNPQHESQKGGRAAIRPEDRYSMVRVAREQGKQPAPLGRRVEELTLSPGV